MVSTSGRECPLQRQWAQICSGAAVLTNSHRNVCAGFHYGSREPGLPVVRPRQGGLRRIRSGGAGGVCKGKLYRVPASGTEVERDKVTETHRACPTLEVGRFKGEDSFYCDTTLVILADETG